MVSPDIQIICKNKLIQLIMSGLVIEACCVGIVMIGETKDNIPAFALYYSISFVLYFLTVYYTLNRKKAPSIQDHLFTTPLGIDDNSTRFLWIILIFAVIFRLTLLPLSPSDDIYRYLWEGKLQLNGINPYSIAPDSEELAHLRDGFFSGINHKHLTTIYPPITLMVFAVADLVSYSVISMKSFFLIFDLLLIFVIIKYLKIWKRNTTDVAIYAWSPLILISFAAKGHCDSVQIFFLMLALYLYSKQNRLTSALSIGMAVVSKVISVIVVPFFLLKRSPKYLAAFLIVITIFYIPYSGAGLGMFSTLFHFGSEYHYNDSIHFLILCISYGSPLISKLITTATFAMALLFLYWKFLKPDYSLFKQRALKNNSNDTEHKTILRYTLYALGLFIIMSPTVHPWYLSWVVPLLCFQKSRAWMILTGTVVFYYFMNHKWFSQCFEFHHEWVWKEVHWLKLPEYLPFYILLIYEFKRSCSKEITSP